MTHPDIRVYLTTISVHLCPTDGSRRAGQQ
jgi:hypothetical protein